jgi:hypothetical protein
MGALAEICAEVFIINSIVTVLQVPAVDDDDDIALMTKEEQDQIQRTGVADAPYAQVCSLLSALCSLLSALRSLLSTLHPLLMMKEEQDIK